MIEINHLALRAGEFCLQEVEFRVPRGEYAVLIGRTGSGKTCLLDAICGLRSVSHGRILLQGENVTRLDPAQRGIGYVPQDGAMFRAMSVAAQIGLPLKVRHVSRAEISKRVTQIAEELAISHLLARRPRGLSGGERQRVALARALVFEPQLLCLDEPLSALDEETREEMYQVLIRSVRQRGATALHVTHSTTEAQRLGTMRLRLDAQGVHTS